MKNYKNPYEAPKLTPAQRASISIEDNFLGLIAGEDGWYVKINTDNTPSKLLTEEEGETKQDKLTDEQLANIASVPDKADRQDVNDMLYVLNNKQNKLTEEQLTNIGEIPSKANQDIVNSIRNELKAKSIPNNNMSGYPISVTDHLKNENALGYKIFGNSVQAETPTLDNPVEVVSLGDLVTEGEYSGKYKIPVIVCGKNIFNVNEYFPRFVNNENGISYTQSDFTNIYQVKILKDRFNANTQYTLSCTVELSNCNDNSMTIQMCAADDTVLKYATFKISTIDPQTREITITNPSNTSIEYVRFVYGTSTKECNVKISNIQIEEGNTARDFERYVGQIKTIYLNEPLRKLGNISDYIDYKRGKIVRNVKEYTFSGLEYWQILTFGSNKYYTQNLPDALYAENIYFI